MRRIITLILVLAQFGLSAQSALLKEADRKYETLQYVDAIAVYEDVAAQGYASEDLYRRLGDAYYFNADYVKAANWYAKLFNLQPVQETVYSFRYGQSLKATGNYTDADILLKNYFMAQGKNYVKSDSYLKSIEASGHRFKLLNSVPFNSQFSDYPAFLNNDTLYIVSANKGGKMNVWNNEPTSDIFKVANGKTDNFSTEINTDYNEGSMAITKDGKTVFFTRNNYTNKKVGKDDKKIIRLKLYVAQLEEGKWSNIMELPFNSNAYSVGHPALSPDDDILYFVSDMPGNGNKGGTDIYQVELYEDGSLGAVMNMTGFNTAGNEMFPFVAQDGTLYFSSNGMNDNLGGLDVYKASTNADGVFGKVTNLGHPINTAFDDFAFVLNSNSGKGYFASNRAGTQSDDIFSIEKNSAYEEPCMLSVSGMVKDKKTGDPLANAVVSLLNRNNVTVERIIANEAGQYTFVDIDCNNVAFIRAEKPKYQTNEVALPKEKETKFFDILLDRRGLDLEDGADISKLLNPIYFDLDKAAIRPDAEIELQKVVSIMKNNPEIKVDIKSHTDSRANDAYNMQLSERRAQATMAYLTKNGIDGSRLTAKGYGESSLVNGCTNGVPCSEAEHQRNRRSEFIVRF